MANNEAWITLATNDTYAVGALVLASSLRQVETTKKLAVLVTPDVSSSMKNTLGGAFDEVINVNVLDSEDAAHLALMSRPELGVTFTKIHCWSQTQYSKAVFLDADTLVIKNCDELFDQEEIAAVTDVGWPDIFNSGVFVFTPSTETFRALIRMAMDRGSFDGGDQGLLNQYFTKWTRLSFIYNMVSAVAYTYLPAYKQFGKDTKIVHFLGARKPWDADIDEQSGSPKNLTDFDAGAEHLKLWWSLFFQQVQPKLQGTDFRGLAARFAYMTIADAVQMRRWEEGTPEYLGRDSFEHIQRKIALSIKKSSDDATGGAVQGVAEGVAAARGKQQQQQQLHQARQAKEASPPTQAGTAHLQHQQPQHHHQQQEHTQQHVQQQQHTQQHVQEKHTQETHVQQQQQHTRHGQQHQQQQVQQHGHQHSQQEQQHRQQEHVRHEQQFVKEEQQSSGMSAREEQAVLTKVAQESQPQQKVVVKQEVKKEELFVQTKTKSPTPLSKEEILQQQKQQQQQQQHSPSQQHQAGASGKGGQQQQQHAQQPQQQGGKGGSSQQQQHGGKGKK